MSVAERYSFSDNAKIIYSNAIKLYMEEVENLDEENIKSAFLYFKGIKLKITTKHVTREINVSRALKTLNFY